jgi:hypothetical protein
MIKKYDTSVLLQSATKVKGLFFVLYALAEGRSMARKDGEKALGGDAPQQRALCRERATDTHRSRVNNRI